jgi:hypothetical protein
MFGFLKRDKKSPGSSEILSSSPDKEELLGPSSHSGDITSFYENVKNVTPEGYPNVNRPLMGTNSSAPIQVGFFFWKEGDLIRVESICHHHRRYYQHGELSRFIYRIMIDINWMWSQSNKDPLSLSVYLNLYRFFLL